MTVVGVGMQAVDACYARLSYLNGPQVCDEVSVLCFVTSKRTGCLPREREREWLKLTCNGGGIKSLC